MVQEVEDSQGELQGKFALKCLAKGKPLKAYERFVREVDAIQSLRHSAIISIVDHSSRDADFHYYVMELQSGAISLKRAIDDGSNPFYGAPLKAIAFFEQILSALAACKDRGIVHRDLSPANVLVLPDERVKLIDFGLCQIDGGDAVTLSDEGVGTPNYIAPECESGANDDVTWLADLYSAGKILWSAVTGKFAFARESRIFKEKSLEVMLPDCPNSWHLQHIFEKTVRHDPGDRWPTPQAAFEATRHVRSLIEQARPPLQLLLTNCPICGHGELSDFEGSYMVFGNPNPPGIVNSRCDYCGFCFARDQKLVREVTTKMQRLQ